MKPKDDHFGPQNGYRREYPSVESYATSVIKVITLRRRGNVPLGFSIRGGWEHGTGVFVSEVTPGSTAQKQGLRVGDQIVRINGFSIHRAIHMEVLSLLKTCPGIVLKIKRVGILPVKEHEKDPVTWKIVESPSPLVCPEQAPHSRVNGSSLENIIVKVEIHVPGSSSLGCSIAKGPPELPGIFMCTVKSGGIAERSGLEVGDQILEMNGTTFHSDIQLSEAVSLMKSSKDIRLTVKKLAGISLFLDNASSTTSNRNDDCISTTRSISDGLSSTIKDHEFSGSCSSKSEGSSFQSSVSSDSEKDYSISEESAFTGLPSKSSGNKWPKHHRKNPSTSTTEEDSWILEERRTLEEEKRRLEEEKRRLEEEKRKLEMEKSSSSSSSSQMTSLEDNNARDNTFLNELQKAAARMNMRENRTADPVKNGSRTVENGKSKKHKEDAIKRMQHEMLMEEFREAHRKMFGSQPVLPMEEKKEVKEPPGEEFSRMTIRTKKPPPPPPKTAETNNKECQKFTVNGQVPNGHSQSAVPQSEPSVPRVQEIIKETEKTISSATTQSNGIKITVNDKGPVKGLWATSATYKSKSGALVEVTPWNTRL